MDWIISSQQLAAGSLRLRQRIVSQYIPLQGTGRAWAVWVNHLYVSTAGHDIRILWPRNPGPDYRSSQPSANTSSVREMAAVTQLIWRYTNCWPGTWLLEQQKCKIALIKFACQTMKTATRGLASKKGSWGNRTPVYRVRVCCANRYTNKPLQEKLH